MDIKVLGTGCPNCKRLEKNTRAALTDMGIEATVNKVTDMADIMNYDILGTPGLVIDGKVVSSARIPNKAEISSMIADALNDVQ